MCRHVAQLSECIMCTGKEFVFCNYSMQYSIDINSIKVVDSLVQSSVSLLIFCQSVLPVAERGIITLSHNCRIVYMSEFCPFLLYVSDALLLSIYTYLIAKSS